MPVLTRSVRLLSLCLAGVVSLIAGLLLAERIIQPGIIDDFGTSALLGLILLFVLPIVTAFALRHDRRVARSVVRDGAFDASVAAITADVGFAAVEPEVEPQRTRILGSASVQHSMAGCSGREPDSPVADARSDGRWNAHEDMSTTERATERATICPLEQGIDRMLMIGAADAIRAVRHGAHPRPPAPVGRASDGTPAPQADTSGVT